MRLFRVLACLIALAGLAALSAPAGAGPLRIAVISDLNGSYGSTGYGPSVRAAVATIIARKPDLVICTGDMIAGQRARPKFTAPELARMWQAFHATVSDPLAEAGIALLVTPGNHDASAYPGYEAERAAFAAAWAGRLPALRVTDGAGWPFRIAAQIGGVQLIGIDATRSGPLAQAERDWLAQRLAQASGQGRTVVLFGHLPLMAVSQGRERDILNDPALFDLARRGGVDLWLSGHHHAFYAGQAGGVQFVAQGAGQRAASADRLCHAQPAVLQLDRDRRARRHHGRGPHCPDFATPLAPAALPATLGAGPFGLTRALSRAR